MTWARGPRVLGETFTALALVAEGTAFGMHLPWLQSLPGDPGDPEKHVACPTLALYAPGSSDWVWGWISRQPYLVSLDGTTPWRVVAA